jgi:hypothetical protein
MNRKQVWFFIILALQVALIISACTGSGRAEARSSESVIVAGVPHVLIESFNGQVQITTGPDGKVSADVVKYAASGAAESLRDLSFAFSGDSRAVQARAAWRGAQDAEDIGVDLKVRVPEGSDVSVVLDNGKIIVGPGVGDITVEAGTANVSVRLAPEAQFSLQAALVNGEVHSDFDDVPNGRQVGRIVADVGQQPLQALIITLGNGTLSLEKSR